MRTNEYYSRQRNGTFILGFRPLTNANEVVYDRRKQVSITVVLWFWTLTNSDEVVNDEGFGDLERSDDKSMEIESLTEHPEVGCRLCVALQDVQKLAPSLKTSCKLLRPQYYNINVFNCFHSCLNSVKLELDGTI